MIVLMVLQKLRVFGRSLMGNQQNLLEKLLGLLNVLFLCWFLCVSLRLPIN